MTKSRPLKLVPDSNVIAKVILKKKSTTKSASKSKKRGHTDIYALAKEIKKNPRKRKRKADHDGNYHPKKKRIDGEYNPNGLLNIRCDREREFTNESNEIEPVRTSFLLNISRLEMSNAYLSPRKTTAAVSRLLGESSPESYLEITDILERNNFGSPVKVKTYSPKSKKTRILFRDSGEGSSISTFSNRLKLNFDSVDVIDYMGADEDFFESEVYDKVERYLKPYKESELNLSKKNFNKNKNISARLNVSKTNTKSIMGESARLYAEATGLFEDRDGVTIKGVQFEWLHMVADMFARFLDQPQWLAAKGLQSVDNLMLGTYHANTHMLLGESAVRKWLIERYPDGFTLHVKVHLVEKENVDGEDETEYLHMSKFLEYKIKTSDFTIHKRFNLQTLQQPFIDYIKYLEIEMKTLLELSDKKKADSQLLKPALLIHAVNKMQEESQEKLLTYESTRNIGM